MVQKVLITIFTGFLFLPNLVLGSDAIQQLDKFFAEVDSFQGQFKQSVFDEAGEVLQVADGDVALHKPGRFRWQYKNPYPQLILADGEFLWIYDEELLQASAKPIDEALGNAPIMLLTDVRPLQDDFEIEGIDDRDGLKWVKLIPFVQDTEFNLIQIGLNSDGVKKMELFDHFSQKTVVEFNNLETNVTFGRETFTFNAPEGVDVVGYPAAE